MRIGIVTAFFAAKMIRRYTGRHRATGLLRLLVPRRVA